MKKVMNLLLCLILGTTLIAGCAKGEESTSENQKKLTTESATVTEQEGNESETSEAATIEEATIDIFQKNKI